MVSKSTPYREILTPAKCVNVILTPFSHVEPLTKSKVMQREQGAKNRHSTSLEGHIQLLLLLLSFKFRVYEFSELLEARSPIHYQLMEKESLARHIQRLMIITLLNTFLLKKFFSVKSVLTCLLLLKLFHSFHKFLSCEERGSVAFTKGPDCSLGGLKKSKSLAFIWSSQPAYQLKTTSTLI